MDVVVLVPINIGRLMLVERIKPNTLGDLRILDQKIQSGGTNFQ